jgi:hypothetical protein
MRFGVGFVAEALSRTRAAGEPRAVILNFPFAKRVMSSLTYVTVTWASMEFPSLVGELNAKGPVTLAGPVFMYKQAIESTGGFVARPQRESYFAAPLG